MNLFDTFKPYDGSYSGEYDCRENCFLRVYENVTPDGFSEYVSALENEEFRVLQKNCIADNQFVSLGGNVYVTILYTPCDCTMRVTVCEKNLNPSYEVTECSGPCQTAFFGFENDQTMIDCGMCLLFQCPDYSFFIVDSGHYFQFNDNDRIHKLMRDRTPEGQKIVVNGWLITHAHTDHISKLVDFLRYNTDDVVIEGFYQNLLSTEYRGGDWNHEEIEMAGKLFKVLDDYPAPIYKLHTGMKFHIRNLTFEVLSTHEDIYPDYMDDYNDSSCVVMVEAEGSKVFIPGDAAVDADRKLVARFGSCLKCDVVQIAHHGHTGLSPECYRLLNADTAVFPVTRIMFDQDYNVHESNRVAIELSSKHFITGDGTVVVPLPYDKNTVYTLPDETFEDFEKIKRVWRYVYSEERKQELYGIFLENGGNPDNLLIPTSINGWIEPKPPIDE